MAHIYNIKNKVITEYLNKDVIKICTKDPLNYIVRDNLEDLRKEINVIESKISYAEQTEDKKVPLSKMKLDDLKALAEELDLEHDGLNCDELRKIIKDAQGA